MASRLDLHNFFLTLCPNVYFKSPGKETMKYPCIKYERAVTDQYHADDAVFMTAQPYSVTVIDSNPESEIVKRLTKQILCKHTGNSIVDNLYQDYFKIYY